MKKINVIKRLQDVCVLEWELVKGANRYIVEAITPLFAGEFFAVCDKNRVILSTPSTHVGYKVLYVKSNSPSVESFDIIDETDVYYYSEKYENISINALKSWQGISLSFESVDYYDKYILYQIYDNAINMLLETEDCIAYSEKIQEGKFYFVEGYKRENGKFELKATSGLFNCTCQEISRVEKIEISIIIPVYNIDFLLNRTIDSILHSTFKDIEIILVDDGSKDKSYEICRWYENNYPNIKVIKKEHNGVCSARNVGISQAKGEYIALVDSDDIIHPNMYKLLYNAARQHNLDVSIALTLVHENEKGRHLVLANAVKKNDIKIYSSYRELMKARGSAEDGYFCAIWNKIVKADIARKAHFLENIPFYEDMPYTETMYTYAKRFAVVNNAFYVWEKRQRQTTGSLSVRIKDIGSEKLWKLNILSCAAPFFYANKAEKAIYQEHLCNDFIKKYILMKHNPTIRYTLASVIWYLLIKYQIPAQEILSQSEEYYEGYKDLCEYVKNNTLFDAQLLFDRWYGKPATIDVKVLFTTNKYCNTLKNSMFLQLQLNPKSKKDAGCLRYDEKKYISIKKYYELVGQYWAWKNIDSIYLGVCTNQNCFYDGDVLCEMGDFFPLLDGFSIVPQKIIIPNNQSVYEFYCQHHEKKDMDLVRQIILEKYPDYIHAFDEVMKRNWMYYSNSFIMEKRNFASYSEWLFNILFELENNIDFSSYTEYQRQVLMFIAERMFNVWLLYNKIKTFEYDVREM